MLPFPELQNHRNPRYGHKLVQLDAPATESYTRTVASSLWKYEKIKTHIGSRNPRPDFLPLRKKMLKDAAMIKYNHYLSFAYCTGRASCDKTGNEKKTSGV